MTTSYTHGPGDLLPPFSGHPHDPRTPDCDDDDTTTEAIQEIRNHLWLAETEFLSGDPERSRQMLIEAMQAINDLIGAES